MNVKTALKCQTLWSLNSKLEEQEEKQHFSLEGNFKITSTRI